MTAFQFVLLAGLAFAMFATVLCFRWGREDVDVWSISIYQGNDLASLRPHPGTGDHPVLTAADVSDMPARFVADPFLLRRPDGWHLFFEVYAERLRRGVIAHATSQDGLQWRYDRVVLQEPFHLSYPGVFEADGQIWMIPESERAGEVILYRAVEFPHSWVRESTLLRGKYFDPSVVFHNGAWWMWVMDDCYSCRLYTATALRGPWREHPDFRPADPGRRAARPGGRIIRTEGGLVRFSQDDQPTYGSRLQAFRVDHLDGESYRESRYGTAPILEGTGHGWNATGMHHVDAVRSERGGWLAAVDGNRQRRVINWKAGARQLQRRLLRTSAQN